MREIKNKKIIAELRRLARANDGVLAPENVVNAARSVRSPLHKLFDWDDTAAAEKWRIHQARQVLRVTVEFVGSEKSPVRVFVSLTKDRTGDETGYRSMVDVVSDDEFYAQMLGDALDELRVFKAKYARFKELREVFAVIDRVRAA